MLTIIHGDDPVASRSYLNTLLETFKKKNFQINRLDGASLTVEALTLAIQPQTLFGGDTLLVIDGLFGRRESSEKKDLLKLLSSQEEDIVLWEGKIVKKTDISLFPKANQQQFNLKPTIFAFLDSIGGPKEIAVRSFQEALRNDPAEKILASLASRLHLLLLAAGAPQLLPAQGFYRTKILSQAKGIGSNQLRNLIEKFVLMDYNLKTGNTLLDGQAALDLYLSEN